MNIKEFIIADFFKWSSGSYSMFTLKIEVDGVTPQENNPTIFHEYTHYLQNLTTFHGLIKLEDYTNNFLTCFAKLGSNDSDPDLPLISYTNLQQELGDKNLNNLIRSRYIGMKHNGTNYSFCDCTEDDYVLVKEEVRNPYSNKLYTLTYICLDGKKIPLNEITIKENMAMINTLIADTGNDQISATNLEKVLELPNKEYIAIIDYINNYLSGKNILKIVYSICEMSLNIIPFESTIEKILLFIQSNETDLVQFTDEQIIDRICNHIDYEKYIEAEFKAYQKISTDKISLLDKIISTDDNEFVRILKSFYTIALSGMALRKRTRSLYTSVFSNEYIKSLVPIVGCPIIYFKKTNRIEMFDGVPDYFFNDFSYLHGALVLFFEAYTKNITNCPFENEQICKIKKNANCHNSCLKNYMVNEYEKCLLTNSLNCTGIRSTNRWLLQSLT